MKNFDPETFQTKLTITEAAVRLYVEQEGSFTLKQVAGRIEDLTVGEIFEYFPNKPAILDFYYTSIVIRYRLMIQEIDDFEQYSFAEKLSNFIYASLDMMEEVPGFVEKTFNQKIRCALSRTDFQHEVEQLFREFFEDDPRISTGSALMMNRHLYRLLYRKYLELVDFWLQDESEGREVTMALTDKSTAFLQELLYSSIADKGFDLFKYALTSGAITSRIPLFKKITSKFEIR